MGIIMKHSSMPSLASVMTPFPYSIDIKASLADAEALMQTHGIRHLAVTDQQALESIVSARDIESGHFQRQHINAELCVGDVCPTRAYIADVHDPLDRVLDAMATTHIGAVLITREGELAGIFTLQDACQRLAELLRELHPESPPDQAA